MSREDSKLTDGLLRLRILESLECNSELIRVALALAVAKILSYSLEWRGTRDFIRVCISSPRNKHVRESEVLPKVLSMSPRCFSLRLRRMSLECLEWG